MRDFVGSIWWRFLRPRAEQLRHFLLRPILAQIEQQRRETLELERLLLAIARIEGLGEAKDPSRSDRKDP